MRDAGWYIETTGPDGRIERDGFRCGHCQRVMIVKPFCNPEELGGRCTCCNRLICPNCVGKGCDPLEEKLRRIEAR